MERRPSIGEAVRNDTAIARLTEREQDEAQSRIWIEDAVPQSRTIATTCQPATGRVSKQLSSVGAAGQRGPALDTIPFPYGTTNSMMRQHQAVLRHEQYPGAVPLL